MKIEGLLSTEEPDPQQDPHFENKKLERFPLGPDFPDRKVVKTEKRNGRHHCKACD